VQVSLLIFTLVKTSKIKCFSFNWVNAMDRRQRCEKHDWLISKTQSILEHYSCPESCNASCCKNHIIDFKRKEYEKILKNIDKESANILKSNAVKSELEGCYKAINAIGQCPFLINSKCRIYDNRSEACRNFPFVIFEDAETGFGLTLLMCPLSVDIVQDYALWYKSVNLTMHGRLNDVYEQYRNIDKNNDFCIQMKEQNLDSFIEFLERK
jgi:uncharacterized protein